MKASFTRPILAVLLLGLVARPAHSQSAADSVRLRYTDADVHFMTGMIGHHAQAVLIAGWAPTHGASPSILALCERIVNGQGDEIALMQRWLRDRKETVPPGDTIHALMAGMHPMGGMDSMAGMNHAGMDHSMMTMPGMLTPEQLAELDHARGPDFDRLFLRFMIQHHQGAIVMVNQLFGSQGAGEEEAIFKFASDVYADQTTEIDRMQKMLAGIVFQGRTQ